MTETTRNPTARRGFAAAVTGLTLFGLVGTAAPASAAVPSHRTSPAPCTITVDQRKANLDRITAITKQLGAARPTREQRIAIMKAISTLAREYRNANLSAEEAKALHAQLRSLEDLLRKTTDPVVRDTLRTQIKTIVDKLKIRRLTDAQKAELVTKIAALRKQLTPQSLTWTEKRALLAERWTLMQTLHCTVTG